MGNHGVEIVVFEESEGGSDHESASMDVDEDGEFLGICGCGFWEVETSGYVRGDDDIFGRDAIDGVL